MITENHIGKNPSPVLGPRHDCVEKVVVSQEIPLKDTSLSTQLAKEDAEASADADKDAKDAAASGDKEKEKEANEKKAELEKETKMIILKDCEVKKKNKKARKERRKKKQEEKEEEKKQKKCKKDKLKSKQDAIKESPGDGEKKWYLKEDCETNITVILWKHVCPGGDMREKAKIEKNKKDGDPDFMCPKDFMTEKQAEMKCEQVKKVNDYFDKPDDPMLDPEKPVPKCCPAGEECPEEEPEQEESPETGPETGPETDPEEDPGPDQVGDVDVCLAFIIIEENTDQPNIQ